MSTPGQERRVCDKEFCQDHSGQLQRIEGTVNAIATIDKKLDDKFKTFQWICGCVFTMLLGSIIAFGAFLTGQQSVMAQQVAINTSKIADNKEQHNALTPVLADLQKTIGQINSSRELRDEVRRK